MDIKMMLIGMLMAVLIFTTGTAIVIDFGVRSGTNTDSMNTTLKPIRENQEQITSAMQDMSNLMNAQFTNQSAAQQSTTTLSELDMLYKAAGAVARISIGSIGYVISMFGVMFATFPDLGIYMAFAIIAFTLALIISIAYLVFFRIPR
jgi:hypothetical protein